MAAWEIFGYISCLIFLWIEPSFCQDYVVPVYVRADQYGTDHFKIPSPKFGPGKSSFHIEQLIKLENELLGLSGLILDTEEKLHARRRLKEEKEEEGLLSSSSGKRDKLKDGSERHDHNYTREMRFLKETEEMNGDAMENPRQYITNPLAMFPIRKRLSEEWPYIMDNITECSMVSDHVAINDHFKSISHKLKKDGDLDMAYEDLLRLQKTYALPVSSLARGWILDEVTEPLSLEDIIAIANICLNREDLKGALEWLLQVAKFLKTKKLEAHLKSKYMHILGGAYLRLDRLHEAKLVYGQLLKDDPESRIANANMRLIEEKMKHQAELEKLAKESDEDPKKKSKKGKSSRGKSDDKKDKKDEGYKEEWWVKHCRGDLPPFYERETSLKSYIKEIPISGKKYQVTPLSLHPPMYLVKGVFENFTMDKLMEHAHKEIVGKIHSYSQPDEASTAVYWDEDTYWMEKFTYTVRNLTYQRYNVDSHTKLNLLAAVRVYNVGAGGTSNPGRGEMRVTTRSTWEKNFIGRYLMFLTTPKAGGDFVFPYLRIRIKPERGDVLFWQFRTTKGLVNPKVFHWLECPVLLGDLWYGEQMIEHHNMLETVDLAYKEQDWWEGDLTSLKDRVLKKKKAPKQEEDEEEDSEEGLEEEGSGEESDYEEEATTDDGEAEQQEVEEAEAEEEEVISSPKKKLAKKAAPKTATKAKEPQPKPKETKTTAKDDEKKHPKEAKPKMAKKEPASSDTKPKSEKPPAKTAPKPAPKAEEKTASKTEKTPIKKKKVKKLKKKVAKK